MPVINMHPDNTAVQSTASFDGTVEPMGPTKYKFSGTLRATCQLDGSSEEFENTVRLGHGGSSKSWVFVDRIIDGSSFEVSGEGERANNETVEFSLNLNEGTNGQFNQIAKTVVSLGGTPQQTHPEYTNEDGERQMTYSIRQDGLSALDDDLI